MISNITANASTVLSTIASFPMDYWTVLVSSFGTFPAALLYVATIIGLFYALKLLWGWGTLTYKGWKDKREEQKCADALVKANAALVAQPVVAQ